MNLTHEDTEFCNAGGLAKILFIAVSEIASMPDIINGWISEINVLPGGVIYAFDIVQDSAKFSEKKIGPNFYEYQVESLISKNRLAIRNNLEKIDKREFIALAQDNNGDTRVIGSLDNACRFSDEAESGSNFADLNNYKVSIEWKSRTRAAYFPISEPTDEGTSDPIIPIYRALALDDLTDVTIATPQNNQVLAYNSATGQWENKTIANDYVTVGIGGQYQTIGGISGALAAGNYNYRLTSNITESVTWSIAGKRINIESIGYSVAFSASIAEGADANSVITFRNTNIVITGTNSIFRYALIYMYGSSSITGDNVSNKLFDNVTYIGAGLICEKLTINTGNNGIQLIIRNAKELYMNGGGTSWSGEGISLVGPVHYLKTSGTLPNASVSSSYPIQLFTGAIILFYEGTNGKVGVGNRSNGIIQKGTNLSFYERNGGATIRSCTINQLGWYSNSFRIAEIDSCSISSIDNITSPDGLQAITKFSNNTVTMASLTVEQTIKDFTQNNINGNLTINSNSNKLINPIVSGTMTNNGDYNTFRDGSANTINNNLGADYAYYENMQYITANELSGTARRWIPTTDAGGNYLA